MKHRLLSLILVLVLVLGCLPFGAMAAQTEEPLFSADEFANPSMQYRPGVRWWLPGGAIEANEMVREVELLAANGFGYAEINPFGKSASFPAGYEDTFPHDNYDTAAYYDAVEAAVAKAHELGIVIDINMGSGWNANDPSVPIDDSFASLAIGRGMTTVTAEQVGKEMTLTIPAVEKSPGYDEIAVIEWGGTLERQGLLVAKVAGRLEDHITKATLSGEKAEDQLLLDLSAMETIDLIGVEGDTVTWTPDSEGEYALVTLFNVPTGSRPVDSINVTDAYVVDHLDGEKVTKYMEEWMGAGTRIHEMMKKYPGTIRAFFNDSYEFHGEVYYTSDFYEEAKDAENNILGYDLSPYLATMYKILGINVGFGGGGGTKSSDYYFAVANEDGTAKDADATARITYDYNQLVNQFIQEGLEAFQSSANKYGGQYRQEAYNPPMDTIGSAKYVDIPEGEQQKEDTLKRTASGSHLYNRPLTTAEQFTLGNTPFQNDLAKLKNGYDLMATSGINNFFYHGFSYKYFGNELMQKEHAYGETGFCGFFDIGVHVGESNALWPYFPAMNAYAARLNYLGQVGHISMDAALYMPFNGSLSNTKTAGKELNAYGYTWDGINDDAIQNMASYDAEAGVIRIAGSEVTYKAIVVQDATLPVATMEALQALADAGAKVVFYSTAPSRQPSYAGGNFAAEDAKVAAISAAMLEKGTVQANDGAALAAALGENNMVSHEMNGNLRMIRRTLADGTEVAYVRNTAAAATEVTFTIPAAYENVYWLDQNTGKIHAAEVVDGTVTADLGGSSAVGLVACPAGVAYDAEDLSAGLPQTIDAVYLSTAEAQEATELTDFTLTVTADNIGTNGAYGEEKTVTYTENVLGNWKDHDDLKYVVAPGVYTTTVTIDETYDKEFVLDLGTVCTAADVTVNGEFVGAVMYAPYVIDITDYLAEGENTIEIAVTPKTWNRYVGFHVAYDAAMAAGDTEVAKQYQFYTKVGITDRKGNPTMQDAGLIGPVVLEQYNDADVAVTVALEGADTVTLGEAPAYTVTIAEAVDVATATLTFAVDGLTDPAVAGVNGWYVAIQTLEDGVLTAVLCNNEGVTSEEAAAIAALTAAAPEKVGEVSVALLDAVLSAYAGTDSEAFVDVTYGATEIVTTVKYSTYDVNQDGVVNQLDITRAQRSFGKADELADVNDDGTVDITDFVLILNNYTK